MTNVFLSLFIFADLPEGQADDLTKLAAFDMEKLPDAEKLAEDFIRRHQELMLKAWGHADTAVLPDDTIRKIMAGSSRFLELALIYEKVIDLKHESLCLFQLVLLGTSSGKFLDTLENTYGYPESVNSIVCRKMMEILERRFGDEGVSLVSESAPSEADSAIPSTSQAPPGDGSGDAPPPAKRACPSSRAGSTTSGPVFGASKEILKDVKWVKATLPLTPVADVSVSMCSVNKEDYTKGTMFNNTSLYSCKLIVPDVYGNPTKAIGKPCEYITTSMGQFGTHVRRKHKGTCVQCRLCQYHTFHTVDFAKHLKGVHPNEGHKWFEVIALTGQAEQVSTRTLAKNLAEVNTAVLDGSEILVIEPQEVQDDEDTDVIFIKEESTPEVKVEKVKKEVKKEDDADKEK